MKLRKILAGVLCSAMIFTELMSSTAFAADFSADNAEILVQTEDVQETETIETAEDGVIDDSSEIVIAEEENSDDVQNDVTVKDVNDIETLESDAQLVEEELVGEDDSSIEVEEEELTDAPATDIFMVVSSNGLYPGKNVLALKDPTVKITASKVVIPGKVECDNSSCHEEHYVEVVPAGIFDTANSSIESVEFQNDNKIEKIEDAAFKSCPLKTFIFPAPHDASGTMECVNMIGNNTFLGCTNLSKVEFNGCKIDSIGDYAFSRTAITDFTAPGKYTVKTTIGKGAFESCSQLRSVYLNEVSVVGDDAFKDCTLLGKVAGSVRMTVDQVSLGNGAFSNCGFTVFDMSEASGISVVTGTGFGKNLFENCTNLTEIYLPNVDANISDYMFLGCTKLKTVHFRSTGRYGYPESIGENAFAKCSAIQNITIPASVTEIGARAFAECTALSTIEILTERYPESTIEDEFIKKDSLPDKESNLTVKGYMDFLEEYALKKGYKYVDLANKIEVKASFGGSNSEKAKISISPSKAKPGQEVLVTVKIDDKNSALVQNANGSYISLQTGNAPIKYYNSYEANVRMESCTSTEQKFTFNMPYDIEKGDSLYIKGTVGAVKDYASAEKTINVSFSKKSVGVDFIETDPEQDGVPHIVFNKTGQQFKLRFTDAEGRVIAPWRFKYAVSTSGQKMVSVSDEGVVSAISRNSSDGKAIITATLISSGKDVRIIATVDGNVTIDKIDFGIADSRMPKRSKYHGFNTEGSAVDTTTYDRKESVYDKDGNFVEYVDKSYSILVVPKTAVQNEAVSFKLNIKPNSISEYEADGYMVSAEWSSGDTSIAKVTNSKTTNNENTITIPKGALGDTEIRVKVTNLGEDEDSLSRTFENSFIIRIVNDIPRLTSSSVTINTNSELGTALPIVVSDDFPIDGDDLRFDIKSTTNKVVTYSENSYGVIIRKEDGEYYARLSAAGVAPQPGKSVEYKNFVLTGKIGGEEFRIPMGSVKVANTSLSSKVSTSGKINLFYNYQCTDYETKELRGRVKVTQSLTSEEILTQVLMSEKSYKKLIANEIKYKIDELLVPGTELDTLLAADDLRKNFILDYDTTDRQWYIERSTTAMVKDPDTGKEIMSGYIFTYFKGYPVPVIQKITVPTENTKPSYVLDYTSTTVNTNRKGTAYELTLLDSKTKKPPVRTWVDENNKTHKAYRNLLDNDAASADPRTGGTVDKSATVFYYDLDKTTSGLFNTGLTSIYQSLADSNKMELVDLEDSSHKIDYYPYRLKVQLANATPVKGSATLRVKLYNWSDYIDYKFSVSTTSSLAKLKMKTSSNVYNTNATSLPAEFEFALDQSYAYIADLGEDGMTGSSKVSGEDMSTWGTSDVKGHIKCTNSIKTAEVETSVKELMNHMTVSLNSDKNAGVIRVVGADGSKLNPASYSFTFVPRVKYDSSTPSEDWKKMGSVKFTVSVTNKKPYVKLSTSSFTLNGNHPMDDYGKTKYSFGNVPVQRADVANKYELSVTSYVANCKEKIKDGHASTTWCATHYANKVGLDTYTDLDDDTHKLAVFLDSGSPVDNFSRTFKIEGATLKMGGITVPLDSFDTSIKSKKSDIGVTYKTYGSINPVDGKSAIVVKYTIKNLNTEIDPDAPIVVDEFNSDSTVRTVSGKLKAVLITDDNYSVDDSSKPYYGYPNISVDKNNKVVPNQVIITSIYNPDGTIAEPMVKDETYRIRLKYRLYSDTSYRETDTIKVSPNQVVPSLGVNFASPKSANSSTMSTTMYACNNGKSDCLVRVNPKSQSNAVITGVALKSTSSAALKRAYAVEYYDAKFNYGPGTYTVHHIKTDGTVEEITAASNPAIYKLVTESEDTYRRTFKTAADYDKTEGHYYVYVKLLNAAPLVMNKGTNIDIEVKYKNQIKDKLDKPTVGSTFRINVTVKK